MSCFTPTIAEGKGIVAMISHNGRLIVATPKQLFEIRGDVAHPIKLVQGHPIAPNGDKEDSE